MATFPVRHLFYMGNLRARLLRVARARSDGQLHSSHPVSTGLVDHVHMAGHAKLTGQIRTISANALTADVNRQKCYSFSSCQCLASLGCIHNTGRTVRCFSSQNSGSGDLEPDTGSNTPGAESGQKTEPNTPSHSGHISPGQDNTGATTYILCSEDQTQTPSVSEARLEFGTSTPSHISTSSTVNSQHGTESNAFVSTTAVYDSSNMQQTDLDLQTVPDYPKSDTVPTPRELQDLEHLPPPRPMEPSFYLAPYIPQSQVLQRLVGLGVDLSAVEKVSEAADFVVQADWDADIQPRLLFLQDVGVGDAELGHVLTKNPLLLKEDVEDMQVCTCRYSHRR